MDQSLTIRYRNGEEDNKGRGLLIYGGCGLEESHALLSLSSLPCCLSAAKVVKYVDAQQMNKRLDGLFYVPILAIDDIGTEEVVNHYGNKRVALLELVDNAEKNGNLLILTTNLTGEGLQEKYGRKRALDEIFSTMERVPFNGKEVSEEAINTANNQNYIRSDTK